MALIERQSGVIAERLSRLVQVESVSGSENDAQALVQSWMEPFVDTIDAWCPLKEELEKHPASSSVSLEALGARKNVVATVRRSRGGASGAGESASGTAQGRSLILNGHVDVVPPGSLSRWTRPPFSGEHDGTTIHGRGAADMKAGVVAMIAAAEAVVQTGGVAGDVYIQSVIGEETGGVGTLAACVRGYTADAAVIPEPTGMEIWPAQGGCYAFDLKVRGRAAHAGFREHGVSALEKFQLLYQALMDLERRRNEAKQHPLYDDVANKVPINIGRVESGSWWSMVPDELIAHGRYGTFVGEADADAKQELESAIHDAAAADPWLREHPPEITWVANVEAGGIPADHPIVTTAQSTLQSVQGEAAVRGCTAGSDARLFVNYFGIPAILMGPGYLSDAHLPNESVVVNDVIASAKAMGVLIARWCR